MIGDSRFKIGDSRLVIGDWRECRGRGVMGGWCVSFEPYKAFKEHISVVYFENHKGTKMLGNEVWKVIYWLNHPDNNWDKL